MLGGGELGDRFGCRLGCGREMWWWGVRSLGERLLVVLVAVRGWQWVGEKQLETRCGCRT